MLQLIYIRIVFMIERNHNYNPNNEIARLADKICRNIRRLFVGKQIMHDVFDSYAETKVEEMKLF